MDNNMYQDELEQFLLNEVKQHRMYPSDHVWKHIRTELHGYRSWPALTFISVFIITALTLTTVLNIQPGTHLLQPAKHANLLKANAAKEAASRVAAEKSKAYFSSLSPGEVTVSTLHHIDDQIIAFHTATEEIASTYAPVANATADLTKTVNNIKQSPIALSNISATNSEWLNDNNITPGKTATVSTNNTTVTAETPQVSLASLTDTKETDEATTDAFLKDFKYVPQVINNKKLSKFGFQFYITPSTSYRRLSDEKVKELIQPAATAIANGPLTPTNTDVNRVVRHKPAIGYEVGFAVLYNISNRLKFKTGVQLNIRQYEIETFQSFTNDPATISLINYGGVQNITLYSPYNNNVGYKQTELNNKVYQLSIPIGLQWEVIRGKHFGINTEASVQPTLNLNKNVYLLSTDYKHYADGNSFIRKWNINTSVGLNITYRAGKTSWQVGPQVRYQHLPTFSNKYPIKEYLMDYGLRIGFTKEFK